jgi:Serpin (serine protease inhibitor)
MTPVATHRWRWYCTGTAAVALIGIAGWYFYIQRFFNEQPEAYNAVPMTFDGTSDQLKETVIVPTLDTPIAEGNSAIWCSSFQLAWNRLKDDVVKAPIQIANAQTIADRLNRGDQSENDLNSDAVFAAAGLAKDGIVERIHAEMARTFPQVPRPEFDVPPSGAVAYAYLNASSKYDYPFFENDEQLLFKGSAGNTTSVGSFGIRKKDDYAYYKLRQQVQILYGDRETMMRDTEVSEFILDLCKTSQPYQIVLARVNRKATLADTMADVDQKIAVGRESDPFMTRLGPRDTVLIPNMAWKVNHHFKELEGKDKVFVNPALRDLYLDSAIQTIQFRLDRSGAELASEAKVLVKPSASYFHVNRPFLVFMKKRDAKRPFFVAWIVNAELLERK